jgi:hypothetical protein
MRWALALGAAVALVVAILAGVLRAPAFGYPPVVLSGVGVSPPVKIYIPPVFGVGVFPQYPPPNIDGNKFETPTPVDYALGLVVTVSPGAVLTYTVLVTADRQPSANGNWNPHDVLVNQATSQNSNILYPVTGVMLEVTAYTSGSVNLGIAQWP